MTRLLPLLALLAAFPPMATDMYLPAIPLLQKEWGLAFSTVNLSLVLFFGAFSVFLLVHGPLSDRYGRRPMLMSLGFLGIFCGGSGLLLSAGGGPWHLAVPMFGVSFCIGLSRPLSNNFVLEQVDADVGTASSFLVFTYFVVGALAMWLISLNWADKIRVLAIFAMGAGSAALGIWHLLLRTWMPPDRFR